MTEQYGGLIDLSTCEISDALIKLGVITGGFIQDLKLFSPTNSEDLKVIGPAFTVEMVAESDPVAKNAPKPNEHFVDACPSDSVLIISSPFIRHAGCWGGLMSTAAKAKGIQGVVIRGGCRDLAEHHELGFPVFASYNTTLGQKTFVRPSRLSVPVEMSPLTYFDEFQKVDQDFRTIVCPGDIIVCDQDGCVAVPPGLISKVVEKGLAGREADENIRKELAAGKGVKESMAKWR